jgi:quercetin dioxygenase-like cupin family protein
MIMKNAKRRDFIKGAAIGAATLVGGPALALASAPDPAEPAPRPVRRIVTGHDAKGRSRFIMDGEPPLARQRMPGSVVVTELWLTPMTPADNSGIAETAAGPLRLQPPADGSVFRIIDFPPEKQHRIALSQEIAAGDNGSGVVTALKEGSAGRTAGFHRTNTIDYVVVISGEMYALMDEGERLMRSGDVLVQRGTSHAWANRSKKAARLAFILIDAKPAV